MIVEHVIWADKPSLSSQKKFANKAGLPANTIQVG